MTEQELQIALAKMLPEELHFSHTWTALIAVKGEK